MKFGNLTIKNFLTIESAHLNLRDRGLHLLQGCNEMDSSASSNGAGKSSIVDALCWCLYGQTARDVKGDAVINRAAKKDCWVAVDVYNGETQYHIARHRKEKTHKNALVVIADNSGTRVTLTKGTDAETQKVVEGILGATHEVFMAAVYSGQEVMPDLPRKTDKELKTLIEQAAGMERIERAYTVALQRRTAIANELDKAETRKASSETSVARLEARIVDASNQHDSWELERAGRIKDATEGATFIEAEFKAGVQALLAKKPTVDAAVKAIGIIDGELAGHRALEAAAVAAERALRDAGAAHEKAMFAAQTKVNEAKRALEARIKAITNAPAEMAKPCTECGKPHTEDELETFIAHQKAQVEPLKAAYLAAVEAAKVVRSETMAKVDALEMPTATARAAVPDVGDAVKRRAALQAHVTAFDTEKVTIERRRPAVDKARALIETMTTEANPHGGTLTTLREQNVEESARLAAIIGELDKLRRDHELAQQVVRVFSPAGVRALMLDTVTPYLNMQTSDYLSILSDGNLTARWTTLSKSAAGELKEKFSIEVSNTQGADSFIGLSGGEKRKVRLATALALQDLVASRAAQPLDLWIGDEVDDALDPSGLERMMAILERKARERGTVLLISHSDLRDRVDEVTTITKHAEHRSRVEGSLCV